MNLDLFTLVHILICLAGLASGLVVLGGWMAGRSYRGWTAFFLATTVAISVTGFMFPFKGFTPAFAVGGISLVVLAAAIFALYARKLAGPWRTIYVVTALVALYLNFFVLVAQLFQKNPALKALAPTQTEPPFAISQALVFLLFLVLGISAVRNFRHAAASAPAV